jgi:hypothetical protein
MSNLKKTAPARNAATTPVTEPAPADTPSGTVVVPSEGTVVEDNTAVEEDVAPVYGDPVAREDTFNGTVVVDYK